MRIFLLSLMFLLVSSSSHAQTPLSQDQLIRTTGIVAVGLLLNTYGLYSLSKEQKTALQSFYAKCKAYIAITLGLSLICLSSYIVRDVDWLLSNPIK